MPKGICPVCNGTGRKPCPLDTPSYVKKNKWYGYREEDDTVECHNCGSQYMFGKSTGEVNLDKKGNPCVHKYVGQNAGRCLTRYTCENCGDTHCIDSGD